MENLYFERLIEEMQLICEAAGDEWIANARPKYVVVGYEDSPMLDLCGNAHIKVTDGRTKFGKYIKKLNNGFGSIIVPIYTKYIGRQEHGLKVSIAKAGMKFLQENGIKKLRILEYID